MPDDTFTAIRDALCLLFPTMEDQESEIAARNLIAYLDHVIAVYDAIADDPEQSARFRALTESRAGGSFKENPKKAQTNPSPDIHA